MINIMRRFSRNVDDNYPQDIRLYLACLSLKRRGEWLWSFLCGLFSLWFIFFLLFNFIFKSLTPCTRTPWVKSNNFGNFSCTLLQHFSVLIIEYRDLICLLLIAPFSLIWNRHHCRCRTANLGLWSALNSLSSKVRWLACDIYCNTWNSF